MSRPSSIGVATVAVVAAGIAVAHFSLGGGQARAVPVQTPSNPAVQAHKPAPMGEDTSYLGNCTAYLPPLDAKLPDDGDVNRAGAYDVLEKFFLSQHEKKEAKELLHLHYAIALVPDPVHTHLSLLFDRSIESIEEAAQDEGYTYNSSWMPWQTDRRQYQLRVEQLADDKARDAREACPGILSFRRSLDAEGQDAGSGTGAPFADGLIVFVVGEQPTGGLSVNQWENAIHWLRVSADPADTDVKMLHVLGPTFSGSLPSLEQRLVHLFKPAPSAGTTVTSSAPFNGAYVFSGTVGSCQSVEWFEKSVAGDDKLPVRFGVFQENDELQIHRFLEYLAVESGDPKNLRDVAIVSEDETAYGAPAETASPDTTDVCDYPYPYDVRPVRLFYPRDISAVRVAYQKQALFLRQSSSTTESGHGAQTILRSDGDEESSGEGDAVANYSRQQSALAEEADLYGLVSFLRSHHTRYIVLRSTNPLDYLFLTRFLHHVYPEGRVVTVGSEILFRREVDTTEYRGTLALTNYPLLPMLQDWTRVSEDTEPNADGKPAPRYGHAHRVFAANEAEGAYTAMRVLLDRREVPEAGVPEAVPQGEHLEVPDFKENLPDSADPFWRYKESLLPSTVKLHTDTWITVLGRDGYWPVAMLSKETTPVVEAQKVYSLTSESNSKATPRPPPTTLADVQVGTRSAYYLPDQFLWSPQSWRLFLAVVMLVILWHTAGCSNIEGLSSVYLFNAFRPRKEISHNILIGFSSASAFALALPLMAPWVSLASHQYLSPNAIEAHIAAWLLVLCGIGLLTILAAKHAQVSESPYPYWAASAFLAALALLVELNLLPIDMDMRKANAITFYYRSVHLNNGVSPSLPLLCLMVGLYVWSWQILAGDSLLCEGKPLLPKVCPLNGPRNWNEITRHYSRISSRLAEAIDWLARPWTLPAGVWLPVAVVVGLCLISFSRSLPVLTFEGAGYTRLLNFGLLLAVALMTGEAARLFLTWRKLVRLLTALGRTPLCRTFQAMRSISPSSLWSMSGSVPRTQYMFFDLQLRTAKRLRYLLVTKDVAETATTKDVVDTAATRKCWSLPWRRKVDTAAKKGAADTASAQEAVDTSQLDEFIDVGQYFSRRYLVNMRHTAHWEQPVARPMKEPVLLRPIAADCAADILNRVLLPAWEVEALTTDSTLAVESHEAGGDESDGKKAEPGHLPLSKDATVVAGEEFICLLYVSYIQNIVARMRTMVFSMSAVYVATMLSLAFYPFAPRPSIAIWMMATLIVLGLVVGVVYAGMERNKILSYITNTKTELGLEFWLKYGMFLVPPVLALITAQFPEIADSVSSWVQPALDAVK